MVRALYFQPLVKFKPLYHAVLFLLSHVDVKLKKEKIYLYSLSTQQLLNKISMADITGVKTRQL